MIPVPCTFSNILASSVPLSCIPRFIHSTIPKVIEAAAKEGYPIDKMTVAGGSAGHALAMIYAYRDGKDAPVPVVFTFGAVGPSYFVAEDWGVFGVGLDSEESRAAGAVLFSVMSGQEITPEEMADGSYLSKVHAISAADYVAENPVPTVVALWSLRQGAAFSCLHAAGSGPTREWRRLSLFCDGTLQSRLAE